MSRGGEYWYEFIKTALYAYPDRIDANTKAGQALIQAIEGQIEETRNLPDGAERMALMRMLMIDRTHTVRGAVSALYISRRTASRWIRDFVYGVARRFGFIDDTEV